MQISKETLLVLKNFATINTNILVREGSELSTISTLKNIFAKAKVKEVFPQEFAIYDLTSLLSLLTLTPDQEIEFGELSLKISKDKGEFEYFYADSSIIVAPPQKEIKVDEHFVFNLSKEDMTTINKAASIVAAPTISFVSDGETVHLLVGDPKTPSSNSYKKVIGESEEEFNVQLAVTNFKAIPDDYEVVLSKKKFVHLRNTESGLAYWFAAEPTSVI